MTDMDMDDNLEWLKHHTLRTAGGEVVVPGPRIISLLEEIERLRAEIENLQSAIHVRDAEIERLRDEARLMRESAVPRDEYEILRDENERLAAALHLPAAVIFDEAWRAIQRSERVEVTTVKRKLSMHEIRIFLQTVLGPYLTYPSPEEAPDAARRPHG